MPLWEKKMRPKGWKLDEKNRVAWVQVGEKPCKPSTNGIVVRAGNVKLMGSTSAGSSPGSARIFVLGHGVKIKKNIFSSNPRRLSTL